MNLAAILALITQLLPIGEQLIEQLKTANANQLAAISAILADADTDWNSIITTAQSQTGIQQ